VQQGRENEDWNDTSQLFPVSAENDPDVNKEEGAITFRPPHDWRETDARTPGAHSQEIVPLFNTHFCVVYWSGNHTDDYI
jgi:hypothetical protein